VSDDKVHPNEQSTPASKSASNMGTTTEARQADAVENTEDRPVKAAPASSFLARYLRQRVSGRGTKTDSPPDTWDRTAAWMLAHGAPVAVAAITIAVFAIHAHIFAGHTAGDDLSFHMAESTRLMDCLRHGDFDFWNPSANGGYASAYFYQVLPQLAAALPAAIFGHHLFWFQLSVVLPHVAAPFCAYKGMRLLGATPWQSAVGAFCVAFMNGASKWGAGNAGTFNVGLYTQTWALCAFPIALGYAYQWMTQGKRLASAIAWGAFVGLCHPFAAITLGFTVFAGWFGLIVLLPFDVLFAAIAPDPNGKLGWLGTRWAERPRREREILPELARGAIFAVGLTVALLPVLVPFVDAAGFGGFPHRVGDEVGPGFKQLGKWFINGEILDWLDPKNPQLGRRFGVLTWSLPVILLFARARFLRWLWAPAFLFALLLGVGPKIGKIGADLIPPVRFLGGMQTLLAMGIGAGALIVGRDLWNLVGRKWPSQAYALRTGIAAIAAGLAVLIAVPGGKALGSRIRVLEDYPGSQHPAELFAIGYILADQPQGRKQSGPSAENHWWNLMPYIDNRVPATLQMGGGGLQASPNYDFLWHHHDYLRVAWVFDAPYVVFASSQGSSVPKGTIIAKLPNFEVRGLPSPGLVSPVQVTGTLPAGYDHDRPGHQAALNWYKGDQPLKDEVLAYIGSDKGNNAPPAGRTIKSWRQDSPGSDPDIVAQLEVQSTTTFIVRESWHPRWHAYIDGNEAPVRRVTPDFMAVDVTAGNHTLAMRFERPWWVHASWLAWPLSALAAWFVLRRRDRKHAAPAAT
jgi:hypothetical protein